MRLLITGGAGFIGSNTIRHLIGQKGIEVIVNLDCLTYAGHLENLAGLNGREDYFFERVDLRDRSEVRRVVIEHSCVASGRGIARGSVDQRSG
jgi:dTDP-glucose 4,6-dehydratase